MKSMRAFATIAVLLITVPVLHGQSAPSTKDKLTPMETTSESPLKVQIVLTEFDGTQKINSLPYSMNILGTRWGDRQRAFLRYGVRVPIVVSDQAAGKNEITYQDIGTNIDCLAIQREDGTYRLDVTVERSSVAMPGPTENGADWKPGDSSPSSHPLIRSFRDDFTVIVKNGQTIEGTSAVDPVTGHVLKVDVTLTVLK